MIQPTCNNSTRSNSDITKWLLHTICCTVYIVVAFTISEFIIEPSHTFADIVICCVHTTLIATALMALSVIISAISRYLFVATYSIVCLLLSVLAYYKYTLEFTLSAAFIDVALNNDIAISADFITWHLIVFSLISTIIGFFIARYRFKYSIDFRNKPTLLTILLSATLGIVLFSTPQFSARLYSRIPFNAISVFYEYAKEYYTPEKERASGVQYANITGNDTTICVVVVGESLRPANMSVNGYHRPTTPKIETLGVISFDSVYTEYGYTSRSIPQLMTRADKDNPNIALTEKSFIDVFNKAGLKSAAILNQAPDKSYRSLFYEADTTILLNLTKAPSINYDKWLDGDVLPHYYSLLDNNYKLVVIHTIGSHWYYKSHYSNEFAVFTPDLHSKNIKLCDSLEIVNSYDNTVAYTDHILSEIIRPLQQKNAIMLYLSDHGEPLGENGKWLRTDVFDITLHTASLVWMSDKYKELYPERYDYTLQNRHNQYLTDYLYHTVIEAANIDCNLLDTTMSIFHSYGTRQ